MGDCLFQHFLGRAGTHLDELEPALVFHYLQVFNFDDDECVLQETLVPFIIRLAVHLAQESGSLRQELQLMPAQLLTCANQQTSDNTHDLQRPLTKCKEHKK